MTATKYPEEIDTINSAIKDNLESGTGEPDPDKPDVEGFHAALHNLLAKAVVAVEETLGENPQGASDTVVERFRTVEEAVEERATLEELAAKTMKSLSGWQSVTDVPAAPAVAVAVKDAEVANGSKALKSPGGHFKAGMNGQQVYLFSGGPVLVTGTNAWVAHPLIGTVAYVSPTEMTLSVAAETKVTAGEAVIGPDWTAALQAAIDAGYGFIPAGVDLIITGEINIGTSKALVGSGATSRIFSTTKKANMITSNWATNPRLENLSLYGNGWGEQPANVDPGPNNKPAWAKSGCGVIFAATKQAVIANVETFFHGGNATTSERNGVGGIWMTMGCKECVVTDIVAEYNRNGVNEDNYFSSVENEYSPLNNTYTRNRCNFNYIGWGSDSGPNCRGLVVDHAVGNHNVISGVEIHRTNFATVIAPRCEFNGLVTNAPGLYIHGTESAANEYQQVTVIAPQCHFNGSHGIKVSEFITNWKIVGGVCSRNAFHGLFANNKAHKGRVLGLTCRDNGTGGEFDGVRISKSTDVWLLVACYDDQEGPTQRWGVKADEESDLIVVDDGSTFSGNIKGNVSLVGTRSRRGPYSLTHAEAVADGLAGQTGNRAADAFANVVMTTKKARATRRSFRAGEVLTELFAHCTVAATEEAKLTFAALAIYDKTGTVLAHTGNLKAQFLATGIRGGALEAAFTIPEDGIYYIGILMVGTGVPGLLGSTSGVTGYSAQVLTGGVPSSVVENTEKEAISNLTLVGTGTALWFGWK